MHYSVKARDIYCFLFDDVIENMTVSFDTESWFYTDKVFGGSEFDLRLKAIRIITKEQ
jgi:hypothetical protein